MEFEDIMILVVKKFVEIWKRSEEEIPTVIDKKINVMTMSSYQNCPDRRTKIELVERLLFIES